MKIALCLEYPLSLRGGVSVLVESLWQELSRLGQQVVLVSPDAPETLRNTAAGQLEHICWDPQQPSRANARRLADQLVKARVDLAHFHSGSNYGWGNRLPYQSPAFHLSRAGVPVVWTSHRAETILEGYCGPRKPLWFKLALLPVAWGGKVQQIRRVRFEIAVSRHNLDKFKRWYSPVRGRFVHIYHSRLRETTPAAPPGKREPVILNVGHLAAAKGQSLLAEAFARVAPRYPEWNLQLAGHDGGDETLGRIRELAKQHRLDGRILWLGQRDDAWDLMKRAAIYVQPSFSEALGLALQEAMFFGCPSIGSRTGGIPELIEDHQTGLLVDPGNTAQLADAMEQLMADAGRREQWGGAAAASIRAKGMTAEAMARRHLEVYDIVARST